MCGLAGIAAIGVNLPPDAAPLLRRMGRAVAHRGPDGEREFLDGPVGLLFRRLALVGPADGDQPLFSADESVVLIANGEVYNHHELEAGLGPGVPLRTKSDCEVLAHLYARDGLRFLDRVNGMFAIVLWDRLRNRLVFARDRFGIKPLYYARTGDGIVFGSEIKALFQHPRCPRELDWQLALADPTFNVAPFLTDEPVHTYFRGIEIVPAGTIVTIDLATGHIEEQRYWRLPTFDGTSDASDAELIQEYRRLLTEAVDDCASADAELGVFLSGGIDSTVVAALAGRSGNPHTFTVLNGSTLANGDAEFSHLAATALGLPHQQLVFDAHRVPEVDEWKRLLWLLETPLCGPEQYYKYDLYRLAKLVRPELRGMLLGQASDEFNGGYSVQLSRNTDWAGFEAGLRDLTRRTALGREPRLASWWTGQRQPLLADELVWDPATMAEPYAAFVRHKYRDIQQYNCWHEDRTAAGNGVEARVPFLDHRVVELLATIPPERRATLLWDKNILRAAVGDLLPAAIAERPKVSFYHGEDAGFTYRVFTKMLTQNGSALLEEALAAPGAHGVLQPEAMRAALNGMRDRPGTPDIEFLLRLVNLGLLDQMTRQLPTLPVDAPRRELPSTVSTMDVAALSGRMYDSVEPLPHDLITLGDQVQVVHAHTDPTVLYIAVDGQFEYVVDSTDDPDWHAFLCAVDGERSLAQVLATAATSLPAVTTTLRDAVDLGIIVTTRS